MPTICLSDDRASDGVGLRLAVASIRRYQPDATVVVHCAVDDWMNFRSVPGALLRVAGLGNRGLRGLPLTAAATAIRFVKPRGHRGPAGW
jgi:hypothetical protein